MCWEMIEGRRYKSTETTAWSHTCSTDSTGILNRVNSRGQIFWQYFQRTCRSQTTAAWSFCTVFQYWLGLCLLGTECDYTVGGWVCLWQVGRNREKRQTQAKWLRWLEKWCKASVVSVIRYSPPNPLWVMFQNLEELPKSAGILQKERKREGNDKMNK